MEANIIDFHVQLAYTPAVLSMAFTLFGFFIWQAERINELAFNYIGRS